MMGLGPYYQVNKIANKQQSIKESTYLKAMEPSTLQTTLRSLVAPQGGRRIIELLLPMIVRKVLQHFPEWHWGRRRC